MNSVTIDLGKIATETQQDCDTKSPLQSFEIPKMQNQRGPLDDVIDFVNEIPLLTRYTLFLTLSLSLSLQFGLVSGQQLVLLWDPLKKLQV